METIILAMMFKRKLSLIENINYNQKLNNKYYNKR